jgi:hypothetical protein
MWPTSGYSDSSATITLRGDGFLPGYGYTIHVGSIFKNPCIATTSKNIRCEMPPASEFGLATKENDTIDMGVMIALEGSDDFLVVPFNFTTDKRDIQNLDVASSPIAGMTPIIVRNVPVAEGYICDYGAVRRSPNMYLSTDPASRGVYCWSQPLPRSTSRYNMQAPTLRLINTSATTGRDIITPDFELAYNAALDAVSVQPTALPHELTGEGAGFTLTLVEEVQLGMACRLYPGGATIVVKPLGGKNIGCRARVNAPGDYVVQLARFPGGCGSTQCLQWETTSVKVEVFEQPSILSVSPPEIFLGQNWTLNVLGTRFPELRLTVQAFRCQIGLHIVEGDVQTNRIAKCYITPEDVEIIGPGSHYVEVLVDGVHITKSFPGFMVTVHPMGPTIVAVSSEGRALAHGSLLHITGTNFPPDAECVFGEEPTDGTLDKASEVFTRSRSAAYVHNSTSISCAVPNGAPFGMRVPLRMSLSGQMLEPTVLRTLVPLIVVIVEQPVFSKVDGLIEFQAPAELRFVGDNQNGEAGPFDGGGQCAFGALQDIAPFDDFASIAEVNSTCPGCGGICTATPLGKPEVELRYRLEGTQGWPAGGAVRIVPVTPPITPIEMLPRAVLADNVVLRISGGGLQDFLQQRPGELVCRLLHSNNYMSEAEMADDAEWPLLCRFPQLFDVEGLSVSIQLGRMESDGGVLPLGPMFSLTVLKTPRVLECSPPTAPTGTSVALSLFMVNPPPNATYRCDFGSFGTAPASLQGGMTIHCITPEVPSTAVVHFRLAIYLTTQEPLIVQPIYATVDEFFRFVTPPAEALFSLFTPASAPLGIPAPLEWYSPTGLFEVLAITPYRCAWIQTNVGDVSVPAIALSPNTARCRVPVASLPHIASVRLEDPTGRSVADVPLFRFFPMLQGYWILPTNEEGAIPPSSTLRYQTTSGMYPSITFGQPLPGVSTACSFGKVAVPLSLVDIDGIECVTPSEIRGPVTLTLFYDNYHYGNSINVTLASSTAASAVAEEDSLVIPQAALLSLEPNAGPIKGGTMVTITLKRPWVIPQLFSACLATNRKEL